MYTSNLPSTEIMVQFLSNNLSICVTAGLKRILRTETKKKTDKRWQWRDAMAAVLCEDPCICLQDTLFHLGHLFHWYFLAQILFLQPFP